MTRKNFTLSRTYCCKCGQEGISIPRSRGAYREPGHLKKLYCFHCQKEWNHAEVRSKCSDYNYNDFKLEFDYNNFDEEGNRIKPYRIFRGDLKKEGII